MPDPKTIDIPPHVIDVPDEALVDLKNRLNPLIYAGSQAMRHLPAFCSTTRTGLLPMRSCFVER